MKISPNDTIRKVIIKNGTLFGIGNNEYTNLLRHYPSLSMLRKNVAYSDGRSTRPEASQV